MLGLTSAATMSESAAHSDSGRQLGQNPNHDAGRLDSQDIGNHQMDLVVRQQSNVLPKRCVWHWEGHAKADAALEGCVNGIWLVCDQYHNTYVGLQMMQQHTCSA